MEGHEAREMTEIGDRPLLGTVLLGLGSNIGDRMRHLESALQSLRAHVHLEQLSSVYETQPVGVVDQPWFLNLVCQGTTRLRPRPLLEFLHEIEDSLGRERGTRFGPRTIDIDILAYDDDVIDGPDLQIPHPRLEERRFVLEPLAEIAPGWHHPVSGKTPSEMLANLDGDVVRPYRDPPPIVGPSPIL